MVRFNVPKIYLGQDWYNTNKSRRFGLFVNINL
jgi:hypothetical protein